MRYIDEFRNKSLIKKISDKIRQDAALDSVVIMEICGTHTQSFCHFGLNKLVPPSLKFIAGPGCPVCVSDQDYIDKAIGLAKLNDVIILSFGDMLRVPGRKSTLEKQRAEGSDVRIIYSAWDSLRVAKDNPHKRVVFLAVGFETTAPTIALTIIAGKKAGLKNLFFYSALKLIPPAMRALVSDSKLKINGFLCPGHVSAIIGMRPYEFIPKRHKIGCCVAGFEPLDILQGILLLVQQIAKNKYKVENQYTRLVRPQGNLKAQRLMRTVFTACDTDWRGLGKISKSGLKIKSEFSQFNAEKAFDIRLNAKHSTSNNQCRCGDILKGLINPADCPLFSRICTPIKPVGPCMVSNEGACNAYYKYK